MPQGRQGDPLTAPTPADPTPSPADTESADPAAAEARERVERQAQRHRAARDLLSELDLLEEWRAYGEPIIVGSLAHGLLVEPDIDIEVFTEYPDLDNGFEVLRRIARHPMVKRCAFSNKMDGPDQGYYWRVVCERDDVRWNIDTWLLATDHPGPIGRDLVVPMRQALDTETRDAILAIKEEAYARSQPVQGIWTYQAVLDHGIRGYEDFERWLRSVDTDALTDWRPTPRGAPSTERSSDTEEAEHAEQAE